MPFIGNQPALAYTSFAKQDFTTSATTNYVLDQAVTNANEIALFINFVRQEPTTAYTASGTALTLTSATTAGDDMYCIFLGKALQTVNPPAGSVGASQITDGSITSAKLNYPLTTFSSTGIDDNATANAITINSSETTTLKCAAGDSNFALQAYHPTSTSTRSIAKFQSNVGGTQTDRVVIKTSGGLNVGSSVSTASSSDGDVVVGLGVVIGSYNGDYRIAASSLGGGSGTLYIGNAAIQVSSDERLKTNITNTTISAIDKIKQVRIVDFNWNDPSDTSYNNRNARGTWTGVIAQELINVFPFAVNAPRKEEDLSIDNESETKWQVDQANLVPVLIKAIQEQQTKIETLEARITALENA